METDSTPRLLDVADMGTVENIVSFLDGGEIAGVELVSSTFRTCSLSSAALWELSTVGLIGHTAHEYIRKCAHKCGCNARLTVSFWQLMFRSCYLEVSWLGQRMYAVSPKFQALQWQIHVCVPSSSTVIFFSRPRIDMAVAPLRVEYDFKYDGGLTQLVLDGSLSSVYAAHLTLLRDCGDILGTFPKYSDTRAAALQVGHLPVHPPFAVQGLKDTGKMRRMWDSWNHAPHRDGGRDDIEAVLELAYSLPWPQRIFHYCLHMYLPSCWCQNIEFALIEQRTCTDMFCSNAEDDQCTVVILGSLMRVYAAHTLLACRIQESCDLIVLRSAVPEESSGSESESNSVGEGM
jgi:hypothetical protein